MTDKNGTSQAESLAKEIMEITRSTLLVRLRFLEPVIMALWLAADPETEYATDAWSVYYGFMHVLRSYRIQKELVFHDYLHMVLHLLFHHPFIGRNTDPYRWDLACDLAVEAVIDELDLAEAECVRSDQYRRLIEEFRSEVPVLTAERIYHYLGEHPLDDTQLMSLRELIASDDHGLWYKYSKSKDDESSAQDPDDQSEDNNEDSNRGESGAQDKENADGDNSSDGDSSNDSESSEEQTMQPDAGKDAADKQWKDISARVQTDLETESRRWAEKSGSLLRNIRESIRKKQSYRQFLEQFMTLGEVMKINDAEFDYIYYTYGMELYGNIPLIEPLEYLDEKRVRELAVVIDTSASVDGTLIRSFLRRTMEILKDTDSFFTETEIRVILCDAVVQGNYPVRSEEDVESLMDVIEVKGFGGTDFRPAFRYIDELLDQSEFNDLSGVLYLTDGYGIFPEWQPQYETAFVFIDDPESGEDPESVKLPPWAMRMVLSRD